MTQRFGGDISNDFALKLRTLRAANGLTVRALAEAVGVSKVTIWKWEGGSSRPRRRMIASVARALGIDTLALDPAFTDLAEGIKRGAGTTEVECIAPLPLEPPAKSRRPQATDTVELSAVISRAKEMIARASGVDPDQVAVRIKF